MKHNRFINCLFLFLNLALIAQCARFEDPAPQENSSTQAASPTLEKVWKHPTLGNISISTTLYAGHSIHSKSDTYIVIELNSESADPGKFRRVRYELQSGKLYLCEQSTLYDSFALANAGSDDAVFSGQGTSGCNSNAWTNLSLADTTPSSTLASEFETLYSTRCIDNLVSHNGTVEAGFPASKAFGPPRGDGQYSGGLDVFVIGEAKEAIFRIQNIRVTNSAGIDFKVFENGFENQQATGTFGWDLGTVEVSFDQITWYGFSPQYSGSTTTATGKSNLVGLKPVRVNYLNNALPPKWNYAGGDGFDLANAREITNRADGNPLNFTYGNTLADNGITSIRFIKIVDGGTFLSDGIVASNGLDIDAICVFSWQNDI